MIDHGPFEIIRTSDQWLRCAHDRTALDTEDGWVELAPATPAEEGAAGHVPAGPPAGLAFDRGCRLYHALPEAGQIESLPWSPEAAPRGPAQTIDLVAPAAAAGGGDFTPWGPLAGPLVEPRALAVAGGDLLFVAEAGRNRVLVYDLFDRRLARAIALGGEGAAGPRPIDLAVQPDGRVRVLTEHPRRLFTVDATGVVADEALPAEAGAPTRLAASAGGQLALLDTSAGRVLVRPPAPAGAGTSGAPAVMVEVGVHATDLEFESESVLVLARRPGQDFLRVAITGAQPTRAGLRARDYDGRGIALAPDGRGVIFWTTRGGPRRAIPARRQYVTSGRVTTYRLDSGRWHAPWGRLFLDACLPAGSNVRVFCAAADEPPEEALLARTRPVNAAGLALSFEELTPMPPASFVPAADDPLLPSPWLPLYRRAQGPELPWVRDDAPDDEDEGTVSAGAGVGIRTAPFITLEAPVQEAPDGDGQARTLLRGRYLWVTIRLSGDGRVTPRVRCLRVEQEPHDYLRRLPKIFSAQSAMESFLHRYLAMFAGALGDLDAQAAARAALLDPGATPDEALPWLASFMGLVLDERWARAPRPGGKTVDARRQLIREAACLFRLRGTVYGLRRFIEIYAGPPVIVFEQFRARGLGGALLGARGSVFGSAVVGAGLRVGGAVGADGSSPLTGTTADAFRTHAHRFSVLVPAALTDEQRAVVQHIVEVHRPAHTLFEICNLGPGMRLGVGLHVGISSFVGNASRWTTARVGQAALGRGAILGRPRDGLRVGQAVDGRAGVA